MMNLEKIPDELRESPRWVLWRDENGTKVPKVAGNPERNASSTDPSTWCSFQQAVDALPYADCTGLGYVLGDGLGGVDLDACRDPETGELAPWAQRTIEAFGSYSEVSPSGTGVKVLARGAPDKLAASRLPMPGEPIGGKQPMLEAFATGRYFTITGEALNGSRIVDAKVSWARLSDKLAEHATSNGGGRRDPSEPLEKGARNDGLFRAACAMRREGLDGAAIAAALAEINSKRCDPPLKAAEVRRIAQSASRYAPGEGDAADRDLSHDALALELGEQWSDARYVNAWKQWMLFTGTHWTDDKSLIHLTRTRDFLRAKADELQAWAAAEAKRRPDDADKVKRWAARKADTLGNAQTVAAVAGLARSNETQAETTETWDRDPFKIGGAATVELETGTLREPCLADYITKTVAVKPAESGGAAALWAAFLERITGGDEDLQSYLQRMAGYALTGCVDEHVLFFLYGTGANGKSVFTNTLLGTWNDYAVSIGTEMLMTSNNERHPTEVARLRGARLAVAGEVEIGRTWAEAKIKQLTGGDPLQARFMRQDFFEFDPQFKLVIVGNHKPSLRGVDEAIRRRLHLIPFTVTIPADERDLHLPEKLRAEWPAILRWAIDGCLEWQQRGLDPPACVLDATDDYLSAEDAIGAWLEERTREDANCFETTKALYADWKQWAETAGEYVGSQKRFAQRLTDRGLEKHQDWTAGPNRGARGFLGLDLRTES